MKHLADFFKTLSDGANNFGTLSITAVWALFCMTLGGILWYDKKEAHRKDIDWLKIRTEDSLNDAKMADAIHMLAEDSQRRTDALKELKIIIDERLARRT